MKGHADDAGHAAGGRGQDGDAVARLAREVRQLRADVDQLKRGSRPLPPPPFGRGMPSFGPPKSDGRLPGRPQGPPPRHRSEAGVPFGHDAEPVSPADWEEEAEEFQSDRQAALRTDALALKLAESLKQIELLKRQNAELQSQIGGGGGVPQHRLERVMNALKDQSQENHQQAKERSREMFQQMQRRLEDLRREELRRDKERGRPEARRKADSAQHNEAL